MSAFEKLLRQLVVTSLHRFWFDLTIATRYGVAPLENVAVLVDLSVFAKQVPGTHMIEGSTIHIRIKNEAGSILRRNRQAS